MSDDIFELIIRQQRDELSEHQSAQLNSWRSASSDNQSAYKSVVKLWQESGEITYLSADTRQADWEKVQSHIRRQNRPLYFRWAASISLLVVASYLIYFFLFNGITESPTLIAHHNVETFTLSDGTTVTLDQGASLKVSQSYDEDDRRVVLEGTGQFQVTKNPDRPFIVETGNISTTVLGTEFSLEYRDHNITLSVIEGKVAFDDGATKEILTVGMAAAFSASQGIKLIQYNPNHNAWKTQRLIFEQTPLSIAITDIEKLYHVDIELDEIDDKVQLSTVFEKATIEEVLNEISIILGAKVSITSTGFKIYSK
ncbi:MAG: FecR domain-containing protein [Cyclobacteriaceae bacterium]